MSILKQISEFLQQGDDEKVFELTQQAIKQEIAPKSILNDGLILGMDVVGEQFRKHDIFLPDVLLAAKAMYVGLDLLKPLFTQDEMPSLGKVVIGTVQGDLHDIGKNLVKIMLEGAGFEVIDLGKDVPAQKFIDIAKEKNARLIGMSTLLTTTMPKMKKIIELLKENKLDGTIKTIIGGAPVSKEYAKEIGSDAYAYDASNAVEIVKKMIQQK